MTRLTNRKQKMSGFGLHSRGEFGNLPVWLPRIFVWCLLCCLMPQCSPPGCCEELVIRVGSDAGDRSL
ncbi:MAG: hypothetical protein ACK6DB_08515, partial [Planctomycetota bacterium]